MSPESAAQVRHLGGGPGLWGSPFVLGWDSLYTRRNHRKPSSHAHKSVYWPFLGKNGQIRRPVFKEARFLSAEVAVL